MYEQLVDLIAGDIPQPLTADNAHELQTALSELIERLNAIMRLLEEMSA